MLSLPLPNLDDRRWADLTQEGQALIPFYAPEWTDHNESDPGITFVELLAWLAEMDIYQINRITERHRRKFLALAGIRPYPPQASRTVIAFRLPPAAALPATPQLPASIELEARDPFGQPVRFRTLDALDVVACQVQALHTRDARGYHDLTARWLRGETVLPFGEDPQPGTALYIGFDRPLPQGLPVSLYFTFAGQWSAEEERQRLIEEVQASQQLCRPMPSLVTCAPEPSEPVIPSSTNPARSHHSVTTAWQYLDEQIKWQPLDPTQGQVDDDTRSFTWNGRVVLRLPGKMGKARFGQAGQELYTLRCRFSNGSYEAAPELQSLAVNAVRAEQAVTPTVHPAKNPGGFGSLSEKIGEGTGTPLQVYSTSEKIVQQESVRIFTLENGELLPWELRHDLDASGPLDRHFVLDATLGQIRFGDGQEGRVPPPGAPVLAAYLVTRAEVGNLQALSPMKFVDNERNHALLPNFTWVQEQLTQITNVVPARGGAAAETLAHAEGRAFEQTLRIERAVTLADIEWLARNTPGARVARAWAQANRHPAFSCFQAPGIITLVILPHLPKDRPTPSRALRQRVRRYVSRRRVIGTRLEVIGPQYVEISIRARVEAQNGTNPVTLREKIEASLDRFFHPLTGGSGGQGWPFGRDVYRSEVLQVIDETPGVDHVISLEISTPGSDPQCANICLGPVGLVAAGRHQIEIGGSDENQER